jgi:hypothetical protein
MDLKFFDRSRADQISQIYPLPDLADHDPSASTERVFLFVRKRLVLALIVIAIFDTSTTTIVPWRLPFIRRLFIP